MALTKEQVLKNWQKLIQDSNGGIVALPDKFTEEWDAVEKMRANYNEKATELNELECLMTNRMQNLFVEIRKHFAAAGMKDIWNKDMGPNATAGIDGLRLINITERMR